MIWNSKNTALIGATGYVGSTLSKQVQFEFNYSSRTISDIRKKKLNFIICAGLPAQKWIANREPEQDKKNTEALISHLQTIESDFFVLISTIDVFSTPIMVDEKTPINELGLHAYGQNRFSMEKFVKQHFKNHLIVRLPGLVGPGLRKNIIYDFLNNNNLNTIDSRNVYQFYPMANLWYDIVKAKSLGLSLVHLTAEPISVAEVANLGFGFNFTNHLNNPPVSYDFRSQYVSAFGYPGLYHYSKKETLSAIRTYCQSETKNPSAR